MQSLTRKNKTVINKVLFKKKGKLLEINLLSNIIKELSRHRELELRLKAHSLGIRNQAQWITHCKLHSQIWLTPSCLVPLKLIDQLFRNIEAQLQTGFLKILLDPEFQQLMILYSKKNFLRRQFLWKQFTRSQSSMRGPRGLRFLVCIDLSTMVKTFSKDKNSEGCSSQITKRQLVKEHLSVLILLTSQQLANLTQ